MHPLLKELQGDNDPHDFVEIAPAVALTARADHELPTLAPGAVNPAAEPQIHVGPGVSAGASAPSLDTIIRAADVHDIHAPGEPRPAGRWARRLFIGVLFAIGSAAAAEGWQQYGDAARAMIANWTPQLVATSSPPANAAPSEQPVAPDTQAAAATAAPAQPAPPAPPPQDATASAPSPGQAPLLQSMAQQIEQLKASVAQLKAGQEQMSRDIAKAFEVKASVEQNLRPRIATPKMATPPPRSAAAPVRKPQPVFSAAPYVPPPPLPPTAAPPVAQQPVPEAQATVETDGNPVVRPPLPVR